METRIPKKIHYIWLGDRPLDKVSIKCIDSWKKFLPDYEIVRWGDNECRSIIENNTYAKQAYENKKYAFVSDYIRLYVLYHYGGIYMDTDVQVFRTLDTFLNQGAFSCFENEKQIPTALMASEKGNEWVSMLLHDYDSRLFIDEEGKMDLTTNVVAITNLSLEWGLVPNGKEQILPSDVHIYTKDYFCPIDTVSKKNDCFTENTYAAHLYNGSWRSPMRQRLSSLKKRMGINPDKIIPSWLLCLLRKI